MLVEYVMMLIRRIARACYPGKHMLGFSLADLQDMNDVAGEVFRSPPSDTKTQAVPGLREKDSGQSPFTELVAGFDCSARTPATFHLRADSQLISNNTRRDSPG
jgi:hypothetical protein